jgi:mannose-6-phosphate isomerase
MGDAVLIPAGTVHSLSDVVVFEVQENSDVTFRLFDWNHIDPRRIGLALCKSIKPWPASISSKAKLARKARWWKSQALPREKLMHCDHFGVWRISGSAVHVPVPRSLPRV